MTDEPTNVIVLPMISKLYGTDPRNLLEQVVNACNAISHARKVLGDAAPNARDYDPMAERGKRHADAMRQHLARIARLDDTLAELRAIGEHVADQIPEVARRDQAAYAGRVVKAVAADLRRDPATSRTVDAAKNDPDEHGVGVVLTAGTLRAVLELADGR